MTWAQQAYWFCDVKIPQKVYRISSSLNKNIYNIYIYMMGIPTRDEGGAMFAQFGPHYPLSVDDLTVDWSLLFGSSGAPAVPKSITDAPSIRIVVATERILSLIASPFAMNLRAHVYSTALIMVCAVPTGVRCICGIATVYAVYTYMCEKVRVDSVRFKETAVTHSQPARFTVSIGGSTAVLVIYL